MPKPKQKPNLKDNKGKPDVPELSPVEQIVQKVFPPSLRTFGGKWILLKIVAALAAVGLITRRNADKIKGSSAGLDFSKRRAMVTAALDLTKMADKYFLRAEPPTEETVRQFLKDAEDKGVSNKRALSFLKEVLDRDTLKKLKVADTEPDTESLTALVMGRLGVPEGETEFYVDVMTGEVHNNPGGDRMRFDLSQVGGESVMARTGALIPVTAGKTMPNPTRKKYPKGITEDGKEVWEWVVDTNGKAFVQKYKEGVKTGAWVDPKTSEEYNQKQVRWAYTILTYNRATAKRGIVPFSGGSQPLTEEEKAKEVTHNEGEGEEEVAETVAGVEEKFADLRAEVVRIFKAAKATTGPLKWDKKNTFFDVGDFKKKWLFISFWNQLNGADVESGAEETPIKKGNRILVNYEDEGVFVGTATKVTKKKVWFVLDEGTKDSIEKDDEDLVGKVNPAYLKRKRKSAIPPKDLDKWKTPSGSSGGWDAVEKELKKKRWKVSDDDVWLKDVGQRGDMLVAKEDDEAFVYETFYLTVDEARLVTDNPKGTLATLKKPLTVLAKKWARTGVFPT